MSTQDSTNHGKLELYDIESIEISDIESINSDAIKHAISSVIRNEQLPHAHQNHNSHGDSADTY